MTNNLLNDLEKLVSIHKEKETSEAIRWIPICEAYKNSNACYVYKEKGGNTLGKPGRESKVIAWIQVSIDENQFSVCKILKQETIE